MPTNHLGQPIGEPLPNWTGAKSPERQTLSGRFCALEHLDPAKHLKDLKHAFDQDETGGLWTYLFFKSGMDQNNFKELITQLSQSDDPHYFAILNSDAKAVGIASYMRIDPASGSIEVGGIAFSPELQRTPAATEAMVLMMQHAFEVLGYRRYEWKCDSLNAPSVRAAKRLGFVFEGTFRQAVVYKGRNRDTSWFSILDKEWPLLKPCFEQWLSSENFDEDGDQIASLSSLVANVRG